MTHDEYVKILKSTAQDMITKSLMTALVKRIPFLGLKFINPILGFILAELVKIIIHETEMALFMAYTDFRVAAQGRDFSEAAIRNFKAQQSGTPEEKKAAEAHLIVKLREFVKLRN